MAIVGRAKYTHERARNFEETRREGSRARVYFARPTIAIAKIRDYWQSNTDRSKNNLQRRFNRGVSDTEVPAAPPK